MLPTHRVVALGHPARLWTRRHRCVPGDGRPCAGRPPGGGAGGVRRGLAAGSSTVA